MVKRNFNFFIILLILILLISGCTQNPPQPPQPPSTQVWPKTFGGSNNDSAWSIQQTSDEGYIVAGYTYSFGNGGSDMYVIKIKANGEKEWEKTFGGQYDDVAYDIHQTKDGGYIVAGYMKTSLDVYGEKMYVLKLYSNGEENWRYVCGTNSTEERARAVKQTSDGGYIIVGDSYNPNLGVYGMTSLVIIKLNSLGNYGWGNTISEGEHIFPYDIQEVSDGYIVVGQVMLTGYYDAFVLKFDKDGNKVGNILTFGGNNDDVAYAIKKTNDGYIVAGYTTSSQGRRDVYVIKLNESLQKIWDGVYGGSQDDWAYDIIQTSDGGYLIAGYTNSLGEAGDAYILKIDANGFFKWEKHFGGSKSDGATSIDKTSDGNYIVAGWTESSGNGKSDVYIFKIDENGNLVQN